MEQIKRIEAMECALDASTASIEAVFQALDQYESIQGQLKKLIAYYESPLWMQDHDDDQAGKLPQNLKRGVLTEDAIYDLLTDDQRLHARIRELLNN